MSQEDPSKTVELFINLVGRHQQAFYSFIHKVQTKGEGLFDSLMRWIELFLTFVRDGVSQAGEKVSLDFVLPHAGAERTKILEEVDKVALYHYKLKVAYEAKVRKRFLQKTDAANEEDAATQNMVDNIMGEMQFGSLIQGDTEEIYAEDDEDYTDSEDESSEEYTSTVSDSELDDRSSSPHSSPSKNQSPPTRPQITTTRATEDNLSRASSIDKPLPLPPSGRQAHLGHQRTGSRASARSAGGSSVGGIKLTKVKKPGQVVIEPPELTAIPELLPLFVEMVSPNIVSRCAGKY